MKIATKIAILLTVCLPFFISIWLTFQANWYYPNLIGEMKWPSTQNIRTLLPSFFTSFVLAMLESISVTALSFVLVQKIFLQPRLRKLIRLAYFPYVIAPVILGVLLQYYFLRLSISGTFIGVFVGQFLFIFPFAALLWSSFWTDKNSQIWHQAATLGASNAQIIASVMLPLAKPWLILILFQTFLVSWFEYGLTEYVGLGKVETLSIVTMNYIKGSNPPLAALSILFLLSPVLILASIGGLLLKKYYRIRK